MSPSTYKFLADAIVVAHLAFVAFAIFGAVLVLRWPRLMIAHLPSVAWVIYVAAMNATCPLTPLENDLRDKAGDVQYEGGFVDHYIEPVLYPAGLTAEIQHWMAVGVFGLNVGCYAAVTVRWRRRRRASVAEAIATASGADAAVQSVP